MVCHTKRQRGRHYLMAHKLRAIRILSAELVRKELVHKVFVLRCHTVPEFGLAVVQVVD